MGNGTFEEIFVVRAVISAGTSLVSSGIYCQRALIIKLKRTTVHVLMVTKELFIDFHFGNHAVFVPCRTRYHPPER